MSINIHQKKKKKKKKKNYITTHHYQLICIDFQPKLIQNIKVKHGLQDHFLFDKPVSPLLLASGMARDWPDARGIWHNESKNFLVWVNEEDHTRVISMEKGGNMKAVFERFCEGLKKVCKILTLWVSGYKKLLYFHKVMFSYYLFLRLKTTSKRRDGSFNGMSIWVTF